MNVPGFLARRFYVSRSLRNDAGGFQLQAQNPMGDGTLVGVGAITIDGRSVPLETVSAVPEGTAEPPIRASELSRTNPIRVRKGDRVTLHVAGLHLTPGDHRLEVELQERDMGALRFSITDRLGDA